MQRARSVLLLLSVEAEVQSSFRPSVPEYGGRNVSLCSKFGLYTNGTNAALTGASRRLENLRYATKVDLSQPFPIHPEPARTLSAVPRPKREVRANRAYQGAARLAPGAGQWEWNVQGRSPYTQSPAADSR